MALAVPQSCHYLLGCSLGKRAGPCPPDGDTLMKKLILAAASATVLFGLSACGGNDADDTAADTTVVDTAAATDTAVVTDTSAADSAAVDAADTAAAAADTAAA